MNVAILFDSMEDEEVGADTLLAGKELYSYSLKTFYLHRGIDCIIMMCRGNEIIVHTEEYIKNWKVKYGVNKLIRMYKESRNLKQVLDKFEGDGQNVELYVLHDVRYPFVIADMIYRVMEKAALYGIAVTSEAIKEDLVVYPGQKAFELEALRYVKYPVAIQAKQRMLDEMLEVDGVLKKCTECGPYLCGLPGRNLFVGTWDEVKMAEAVLQIRKNL